MDEEGGGIYKTRMYQSLRKSTFLAHSYCSHYCQVWVSIFYVLSGIELNEYTECIYTHVNEWICSSYMTPYLQHSAIVLHLTQKSRWQTEKQQAMLIYVTAALEGMQRVLAAKLGSLKMTSSGRQHSIVPK